MTKKMNKETEAAIKAVLAVYPKMNREEIISGIKKALAMNELTGTGLSGEAIGRKLRKALTKLAKEKNNDQGA